MIVALYIKTSKYQDISVATVSGFESRVIADGGTFEASSCCLDFVRSLGGSYGYADTFNRIELFEDEKISLTSSIQNVNDISKVFTDYSQSFTIPASDNNNEIFRHWYENSLDNGFDQRLRYDGYIEIDTQTFRVGKWQLESASVKNNRIENYKITFYGELKSLTDKFGEDKLKDIQELNDYTIVYLGSNVRDKITTTSDSDIIFPLISSDRVWQYGGGGLNDVSINAGHIHYSELFPSLKIARIFDAIENKYGISFSGDFLNQSRFKLAYMWLKNNESKFFVPFSKPELIILKNYTYSGFYSVVDNVVTITNFSDLTFLSDLRYKVTITFASPVTSYLLVYKNNELYTTLQQTGTTNSFTINESEGVGSYRFEVQTNQGVAYNYNVKSEIFEFDPLGSSGFVTIEDYNNNGASISNIDFTRIMPDMKVSEFFSGILKMFNLTAFSNDGINFTLEQLEEWYYKGTIKDFSEYTTTDLDFERIKPYKKINLQYEKSENILSRNFFTANAREFGDLSYPFNNDGSEYTIKLPFENLMFQKFTNTNLQVSYTLKSDFTPYAPKPIILYKYKNENTNVSFYFNNGTTTDHITNYNVMGQDVLYQNETNSLNWGVEISSYLLQPVSNSLFNNYYLAYLNNLYLLKSRMLKVSMRLPYSELLNLKLNDRIVIRDKRYIINSYTTDLTTFESNFELIQDFRSINFNNSTLRQTDNTAKTLRIDTTSTTTLIWSVESDPTSLISGIIKGDTYVEISVKQNVSGVERNAVLVSNLNDKIIIRQDA